ncbi:non-hydrolyzing UDP-N-acetylglucosamine 2-epimerase [Rubinisphaera italica]|nr:UDP-N-acetylglucosamine 2-epimerase (non-hydrolyzing) [Rubinisphaera italica]
MAAGEMDQSSKIKALLVMGTRPEAIKMAPVVRACKQSSSIDSIVCFTGQHREMLAQVADYFQIQPDIDLDLMQSNQSLAMLTSRCLNGLEKALDQFEPDCIVAQGDTTTVLVASMVAFYRKLPFIHVEAGLRTGDLYSPWPEEYNRRVAGLTATIHCAPTQRAADNLLAEGACSESVHVTGNTVIDSLLWTVEKERNRDSIWREKYKFLNSKELVLITGHRRENFGGKFESVCRAIAELSQVFSETAFLYPVHLNPNVREPVFRILGKCSNVYLTEPAIYPEFVWLMDQAKLILTDSGGVQEEAPSLKKPVLVMRDTTERPEAVDAGAVRLVGTDQSAIVENARELLSNKEVYESCQIGLNPYGDGKASEKIVKLILALFDRTVKTANS